MVTSKNTVNHRKMFCRFMKSGDKDWGHSSGGVSMDGGRFPFVLKIRRSCDGGRTRDLLGQEKVAEDETFCLSVAATSSAEVELKETQSLREEVLNEAVFSVKVGIVVGKKVGNSVVRQKIKRRLRCIFREIFLDGFQGDISPVFSVACIIIVRKSLEDSLAECTFSLLKNSISNLFCRGLSQLKRRALRMPSLSMIRNSV